MHEKLPGKAAPEIYSVPRRYDLATLFVMSLAFALLFGGMRLLNWPPQAALLTGLYISLVGLGQAILFKGSAPRLASVIVSTVYWPILVVFFMVRYGRIAYVLNGAVIAAIWGAVVGYFAGTLIGGVFLVAEAVRSRLGSFEE